jgi:arginyl-tRNA--protein-N-Asp/Glu arginylyltransferase
MLTHQKSSDRITGYEAFCFYAYRIACSNCNNCDAYGYIAAIITKFQTTGSSRRLWLEYQAVTVRLV